MPGYIETVSLEATQADVFNSLNVRANELISQLDIVRLGTTNDTANLAVTDTGLIITRPAVERTGAGAFGQVKIFASAEYSGIDDDESASEIERVRTDEFNRIPLLSQGHLTRVESHQPVIYPSFLGAYRTTEPRPDYRLELSKTGREQAIECKLGKLGTRGGATGPYGSSNRDAKTKLVALGGNDRERFVLVANMLAHRLDVIEWMSAGATYDEAVKDADDAYMLPLVKKVAAV